ncbi:phosphonate C-P lyase system protein PhnH [Mesorhizobium sp. VK25A]|uniref:Phosphonate C-P lyase system protein PhnH n=1 Tax=Mesorhizobium vachelliae TaxID=3072309 RepID=A0ABU5A2K3_9HYPH|nr:MULTISPECIES: phosphonate C-P lyase system protein PhnH [unclassified Mesorhizobium]MDX8531904.1 phosphonate C-P lyase system protein PhnH [Mesorhizobium sp. VK25D]MDX8543653.1 phosphonate C-P lyase system protein PhnH [Mesorhizobium sp. VK25A]
MSLAAMLPDQDEIFANAGFDALMGALARPGTIHTLPTPGFAAVVASLIDRECSFHTTQEPLTEPLARTGARPAPLGQADYVFAALAAPREIEALERLKRGNLLYPDDSATLIAAGIFNEGVRLRLSGPGIDGVGDISIGGVDRCFWPLRERLVRYPLGFDLFLVDGDRVIGVPRSTRVEVL